MAEPANSPPMDEILASIRRIITEEPGSAAPAGRQGGDAAGDDDVLELGAAPDSDLRPPSAPSAPVAIGAHPVDPAQPADQPDTLVSAEAHAATRRAFAALSGVTIDPQAGANTMDGLVRDLLRPMLKAWLDTHLPDIVERLVAREVARIVDR